MHYDMSGQDVDLFLEKPTDREVISSWQHDLCRISGIYAYCLDRTGQPLTPMPGEEYCSKADEGEELHQQNDESKKLYNLIGEERFHEIYCRVTESSLEEQAVETTEFPNLLLGAVSIRYKQAPVITWLCCGVIEDYEETEDFSEAPVEAERTVTRENFYRTIDFLRDLSYSFLEHNMTAENARAESRRSLYSVEEMGASLRRTEALTKIVQMLESDDALESIIMEVLKNIVDYLQISSANLCRVHKEQESMDIVAEYCNSGIVSPFQKATQQKCFSFLKSDKVIVISKNTLISHAERADMKELGIKSMVVMPIIIQGVADFHACFWEMNSDKEWQIDDIKFLKDAVRILQSIIAKRIQKNSLASSYASLETILDNVGGAVYVRDLESGKVLFTNRNLQSTFEQELKEGTINELLDKGITGENGSSELFHEDKDLWYDLYYTRINWVDNRPVLLCALYDVTEKKIYQRKIEQQAYTDFLTGLYNRMCCERDLAKHVDEANKKGRKGALLYLDLDDFKHINDGLGHQYGDVLLKAISHSLQRIEGIVKTCYRMGGDEFVIIIPYQSFGEKDRIIEDIKEIFTKPWFLKDADYYCTMSMGVVTFPREGESVHDLIKKADIAMYEAKKSGKNRVAYYTESIDSASGKRLDMEKNMRDATQSGYGEFEVYFQPIIDIQKPGMPCTGAEALIRWNSLEMGFVQPSEFIPLAEYLGLINPIGNYVLIQACTYCHQWNENGHPEFKVNVNLSVVQLLQSDIVEIVEAAIQETQINPANLTLEVTESLAINDMARMQEILGRIKKLGVRIALDDFGTGYSSLNHIREIPFDVIKVDQSFIKDLEGDAYSQSFIKMVGELAEALGANICIEGVETTDQYMILAQMNVSLVQGYYFDRPMKREQFEEKYVRNTK